MSGSRYLCASRPAAACWLLCVAGSVVACGRIGVKVYPAEVAERQDARVDSDADEVDAAEVDASEPDAEADAEAALDAQADADVAEDAASEADVSTPLDAAGDTGAGLIDANAPDTGRACPGGCASPDGTARCVDGVCMVNCASGAADCDGNPATGCEVTLASAANHCGMCGRSCPANGGTPVCSAGVCSTVCNLSGTYALKLSVSGSWPEDAYIRSGNGTFQFWLRFVGTHSGNTLAGTLSECGRFIPPFSARSVQETFGFGYPNSLFDGNFLPASAATLSLASAAPGASVSLAGTAVQMGLDMALGPLARDPVSGAWPTQASQIPAANRLDMDGDGRPGVTAEYADTHDHPRTGGTLFDPRSDNPYVASRVSFSLSGALDTCTGSSGSASFRFIDTRIYACSLDNGECSGGQADFLDQNCLIYTLGAGSYRLVKLAAGVSCAAVRAALP
jgi:hypothetical protein